MGNLQSKILLKWLCFCSPDTTEPILELSNNLTNTGSGESIQSDKFDETTQVIVHDIRTNRNYVKARHDVEST
jgi:flagellar basal body L-ring protein FlgH